jgi:hypothetical protein
MAYRLFYEDGYPLDLIQRYAEKHGMTVDVDGFYRREKEIAENVRLSRLLSTFPTSELTTLGCLGTGASRRSGGRTCSSLISCCFDV